MLQISGEWVWFLKLVRNHVGKKKSPSLYSTYSAEIYAIKEGLKFILENDKEKKWAIVSDCLSALQGIKRSYLHHRHWDIQKLKYFLKAAEEKEITIIFIWIKSHQGISLGNYKADKLATTVINTQR